MAVNHPIAGSIPAPGANAGVALVGKHLIRNEVQGGSTPLASSESVRRVASIDQIGTLGQHAARSTRAGDANAS